MEKMIITCQLVTPLFMYGSNNNLEIRASSIIEFMLRSIQFLVLNKANLYYYNPSYYASKMGF